MNQQGELAGRVALVTGGGRGLGRAICRSLGKAGAVVAPADLRLDWAEATVAEIKKLGGSAVPLSLDVTSMEQAQTAVEHLVSEFGSLDILINNAGTDLTVPFDQLSIQDWDWITNVNLRGPFLLSRLAFPIMKRQGDGSIINIVSTASKRAWANASAYHASKWGLLGLSHALHVEGRMHNIRVAAVIAGGMRTAFLLERFPEIDPQTLQDPENVAQTIKFVLTQPAGTVIPEITVLPLNESSWP
jgi:NAD(P)-dependent dehydrogenase (short-subunit alcohol dehydrogenase family)